MWDIEGYFYFYKDGNPHSNIRIGKASGRVYGTVGGAVVETEQTVEAAVYTFGGQPVKRQRIGAGTTRIPLLVSFYLITRGKSMLLKLLIVAAFLAKYLLPMRINAQNSQIGNFKEFDAIILRVERLRRLRCV